MSDTMLYCTQAFIFTTAIAHSFQPFLQRGALIDDGQPMRGMFNSWLAWATIALIRRRWEWN